MPTKLSQSEQDLLNRDDLSLTVFSDTFSPLQAEERDESGNVVKPARYDDFDAKLTTDWRSFDLRRGGRYGIGNDTLRGAYGAELVVNLMDDARAQIERAKAQGNHHPRIRRVERELKRLAPKVVVNNAPRDNTSENGKDFYLALTDNDVKIIATPLEALSFVRERILALFRIPTEGHPLFNGNWEQFRSSIIARSDEVSDHLVRVYGVSDLEELQANLRRDRSFSPIPEQEHDVQLAYEDNFGNERLRVKRIGDVRRLLRGATSAILRINGEIDQPVELVSGLRQITGGRFGLYENIADGQVSGDQPAYVELVRRWEDNDRRSGAEALGRPKIGVQVIVKAVRNVTQRAVGAGSLPFENRGEAVAV